MCLQVVQGKKKQTGVFTKSVFRLEETWGASGREEGAGV